MYKFLLAIFLLGSATSQASEKDNRALDEIYRLFLGNQMDVQKVAKVYHPEVIHVGPAEQSLLKGKDKFLSSNILPLAEMINAGKVKLEGKVYLVRRMMGPQMANDVGYLYMKLTNAEGKSIKQLQKFSWVFAKAGQSWQVVTDFDATPAPLAVLDQLAQARVIQL